MLSIIAVVSKPSYKIHFLVQGNQFRKLMCLVSVPEHFYDVNILCLMRNCRVYKKTLVANW